MINIIRKCILVLDGWRLKSCLRCFEKVNTRSNAQCASNRNMKWFSFHFYLLVTNVLCFNKYRMSVIFGPQQDLSKKKQTVSGQRPLLVNVKTLQINLRRGGIFYFTRASFSYAYEAFCLRNWMIILWGILILNHTFGHLNTNLFSCKVAKRNNIGKLGAIFRVFIFCVIALNNFFQAQLSGTKST